MTKEYQKPMVVAGFEPLDVLQSILMLIKMISADKIGVENQYTRAVVPDDNQLAQDLISQYLTIRDTFEWRGLGYIPNSALEIKDEYAKVTPGTEFYFKAKEILSFGGFFIIS